MLPVLYLKSWQPALLQDVIQSSMDTVVRPPILLHPSPHH